MSPRLHHCFVAAMFLIVASGCCTTGPCGSLACSGPVAACGGCQAASGCLGFGCLGRLLNMADYGCASGCGEVYYHDWINDPPQADPCDDCGGFVGNPVMGPVDAPAFGQHDMISEPSCGTGGGCGSCGAFQGPGRVLFQTWTGMGGFVRELRQGLFPYCGSYPSWGTPVCAAFDSSPSMCGECSDCTVGPAHMIGPASGCSSCGASARPHLSHKVAQNQQAPVVSRPPHKLIANRMR